MFSGLIPVKDIEMGRFVTGTVDTNPAHREEIRKEKIGHRDKQK